MTKVFCERLKGACGRIEIEGIVTAVNKIKTYTPYISGEKIRVAFIYQIPSFWTAIQTFYEACLKDDRFETKLLLLTECGGESSQMMGAEEFLQKNNICYENFDDIDFVKYRPHFAVFNSPYEVGHRFGNMRSWTAYMNYIGVRVVYVPYGIEFVDTAEGQFGHFSNLVVLNAYRIYTMSVAMQKEYEKRCINAAAVRGLGLPRFDNLYHKERFPIRKEVEEKRAGRKTVIWRHSIRMCGELNLPIPYKH